MKSLTQVPMCTALLALTCAVGYAHADLVSASDPATLALLAQPSAVELPEGSAPELFSEVVADSLESHKTALATRSLALPAAAAPSLWSFVTAMQAQQRGGVFVQLETQLNLVQQVTTPTQVPLPAPLWLLVMGSLGFVGSRLRRRPDTGRVLRPEQRTASPTLHPA